MLAWHSCHNRGLVAAGGSLGDAEEMLQSGIFTIYSSVSGDSFVAIKSSDLDKLPPGCVDWTYRPGWHAVIFSGNSSNASGTCSKHFRCMCAKCSTMFHGEVSSSTPGNFSILVSSKEMQCEKQQLEEFECNEMGGYVRAWDDRNQPVCRLKISEVCKAARIQVEDILLRGSSSSPMVAAIETQSALTVDFKQSLGSSTVRAKVEIRPVQDIVVSANVDESGKATLSLTKTGQFEIHLRDGQSSCKLEPQLRVECKKDAYEQKGSFCKQKEHTVWTTQACT